MENVVLALKSILTTALPDRYVCSMPEAWLRQQIGTPAMNRMIVAIQPDTEELVPGPMQDSATHVMRVVITVLGQGNDAQKVQYGDAGAGIAGTINVMDQVFEVLRSNKTLKTIAYPDGAANGGMWLPLRRQFIQYDMKEKALYCMGIVDRIEYRRIGIEWSGARNNN